MSFERALPFVLRWEGGFVNDPDDPGGATNKGVTQTVYDNYRAGLGDRKRDVRHITDAEVAAIYRSEYWLEGHCDTLPWPLSLAHFDACVNTGTTQATRLLQRAARVRADGRWGPVTQAAVSADLGESVFNRQLVERLKFYDALVTKRPVLGKFFRGWSRRTLSLSEAE